MPQCSMSVRARRRCAAQVDIHEVPDFNTMYELYDPCTLMFFFRNKVRNDADPGPPWPLVKPCPAWLPQSDCFSVSKRMSSSYTAPVYAGDEARAVIPAASRQLPVVSSNAVSRHGPHGSLCALAAHHD